MARQGGRVQLEQSDMLLALNMAKLGKEGFLCGTVEETKQPIKKPRAEVREEQKRGVVSPGHTKVKAVIERHTAMVRENHMDGFLPCQNGKALNLVTRWRGTGTAAPPLRPAPLRARMPPVPPEVSERTQRSKTDGVPPGYVYIHTRLPSAQLLNLDPYSNVRTHNEDFIPDLLSVQGPSTGYYTISCMVMQPTAIL